jgi:hypothetical protein
MLTAFGIGVGLPVTFIVARLIASPMIPRRLRLLHLPFAG